MRRGRAPLHHTSVGDITQQIHDTAAGDITQQLHHQQVLPDSTEVVQLEPYGRQNSDFANSEGHSFDRASFSEGSQADEIEEDRQIQLNQDDLDFVDAGSSQGETSSPPIEYDQQDLSRIHEEISMADDQIRQIQRQLNNLPDEQSLHRNRSMSPSKQQSRPGNPEVSRQESNVSIL